MKSLKKGKNNYSYASHQALKKNININLNDNNINRNNQNNSINNNYDKISNIITSINNKNNNNVQHIHKISSQSNSNNTPFKKYQTYQQYPHLSSKLNSINYNQKNNHFNIVPNLLQQNQTIYQQPKSLFQSHNLTSFKQNQYLMVKPFNNVSHTRNVSNISNINENRNNNLNNSKQKNKQHVIPYYQTLQINSNNNIINKSYSQQKLKKQRTNNSTSVLLYSKFIVKGMKTDKIPLIKQHYNINQKINKYSQNQIIDTSQHDQLSQNNKKQSNYQNKLLVIDYDQVQTQFQQNLRYSNKNNHNHKNRPKSSSGYKFFTNNQVPISQQYQNNSYNALQNQYNNFFDNTNHKEDNNLNEQKKFMKSVSMRGLPNKRQSQAQQPKSIQISKRQNKPLKRPSSAVTSQSKIKIQRPQTANHYKQILQSKLRIDSASNKKSSSYKKQTIQTRTFQPFQNNQTQNAFNGFNDGNFMFQTIGNNFLKINQDNPNIQKTNYIQKNKRLASASSKKTSFYLTGVTQQKQQKLRKENTQIVGDDLVQEQSYFPVLFDEKNQAKLKQNTKRQRNQQSSIVQYVKKLRKSNMISDLENQKYKTIYKLNLNHMVQNMPEMYEDFIQFSHNIQIQKQNDERDRQLKLLEIDNINQCIQAEENQKLRKKQQNIISYEKSFRNRQPSKQRNNNLLSINLDERDKDEQYASNQKVQNIERDLVQAHQTMNRFVKQCQVTQCQINQYFKSRQVKDERKMLSSAQCQALLDINDQIFDLYQNSNKEQYREIKFSKIDQDKKRSSSNIYDSLQSSRLFQSCQLKDVSFNKKYTQITCKISDLVKKLSFFKQMPEQQSEKFYRLPISIAKHYQDQYIITQGQLIHWFYIILYGSVKKISKSTSSNIANLSSISPSASPCLEKQISKKSDKQYERLLQNPFKHTNLSIIHTIFEGQAFGQPQFLSQQIHNYTYQVQQQGTILMKIPYKKYFQISSKNNNFGQKIQLLKSILKQKTEKNGLPHFSKQDLQIMAVQLQQQKLHAKTILSRQNEIQKRIFMVSKGQLSIIKQKILKNKKELPKDLKIRPKTFNSQRKFNYEIKNHRTQNIVNNEIIEENYKQLHYYYFQSLANLVRGDACNWQGILQNKSKQNHDDNQIKINHYENCIPYSLMSDLDQTIVYTLSLKKLQYFPDVLKENLQKIAQNQSYNYKFEQKSQRKSQLRENHYKYESSSKNKMIKHSCSQVSFKKKKIIEDPFIDPLKMNHNMTIPDWKEFKQKLCKDIVNRKNTKQLFKF